MTVGVIGIGYVGLPLAVAFTATGHDVVAVDTDVDRIARLCDGRSHSLEVVDAAATKLYHFMRFEPRPGMGGHCLPVDPFYLSWRARSSTWQRSSSSWPARSTSRCPGTAARRRSAAQRCRQVGERVADGDARRVL